ncbi:hypothetical protein vBVpP1_56 [Vibrio phage vB_VpP_1]|nr:hypothetical protein vBVpP1_56 [Vibrio phage vB_VpP_1]
MNWYQLSVSIHATSYQRIYQNRSTLGLTNTQWKNRRKQKAPALSGVLFCDALHIISPAINAQYKHQRQSVESIMNPYYALLEAFSCHSVEHPHRKPMGAVICKIMSGVQPDSDDIAVLIQGFAMQPYLCTIDLQDAIEQINKQFGTTYTITG